MSRRSHNSVFSRVAVIAAVLLVGTLVGTVRPADAALLSPTLDSVSPNRATPGVNNQHLKLLGDFTSGSSTVTFGPATGITIVGSPTAVGTTEIDVTINVATDAPNTARDVTVTGGLLGSSSTCAKCLTIGPDITAVSGPLSNQGTTGTFTITGHAFKAGSTVKIDRKNYGFGGTETDSINATGVTVGAPTAGNVTTITATVGTFNRAPGRWAVTVTGPDGAIAKFGDGSTTGLEIAGQKPTLSSLSATRVNPNQTNMQIDLVGDGFAQGLTFTVSGSGITQSAKTAITDRQHATIRLNSAATLTQGPRTLVLKNADGESSENTNAICADCNLPAPANPAITSVSPNSVGQGANAVQLIVTGTNFGSLPVPTVTPNDTDVTKKITVSATRDSDTKITLTVSTAAATPAGAEDLSIAFQGGATATKTSAFSVLTTFSVQNVNPAGAARGFNGSVHINGTGFATTPAPTVSASPGTGVTFGTATVDSASRITVQVTVASDAPQSARNVTVAQAANSASCTACFTVATPPTVTSISPTSGNGGSAVAITAVNGTNFAPNPAVTLERDGQNNVSMTEVNRESATKISGTFDLADAAPGLWTVRVTNADGGSAVLAGGGFTVVTPAPTVTSSAPDSVTQATSSLKLTITGTSFAPGMVVTIPNAGGVTVTDVTRKSTTSAEVTIATSDNATLGSRDVKVANTDGKSGTCTSCFVVTQGQQGRNFGPGITAYENFSGGAFVAAGDLDNLPLNGTEFVTAPNAGGGPHIRPYRINPANGNIQELGGGFMAYAPNFTGGVHVAIGNIDGNAANGEEIVTAAGPGGGPHVRVFHLNNDLTVNEPFGTGFMAYAPSFSGGVWVATGDVNGDGKDEIITGAGAGGGPHVRVWSLAADGHTFNEIGGWMAYGTTYTGGVAVAAGNVIPEASDKPQLDEVVTVPALGGGPHTRITNGTGAVLSQFMAFGSPDENGYRVAVGDFDFDTVDDVAVSRGSSGDIYIAQITDHGPVALVTPNLSSGMLTAGTNVAAADVDGDGDADLVLSPDHNSAVTIKLIRPLSNL